MDTEDQELNLSQQVLRTDASGMPLEWIHYQDAAKLYCLGQVAYSLGIELFNIRGGINLATKCRSQIQIRSIIATQGKSRHRNFRNFYRPPLSNHILFARDAFICLYCGNPFRESELSRDHITPLSQNGQDSWTNVVTACKRCNHFKAGRTPEQAGMELLAIPFVPTHAEYIFLQGKRVLADQMEFLVSHFPRKSPLHQRIQDQLRG